MSEIPGVGFCGSVDGNLRADSTGDREILWDHDTAQDFNTVNDIPAKGASMSNGGVAVVEGMVLTNSGCSHHSGIMPGNGVLAFGVE